MNVPPFMFNAPDAFSLNNVLVPLVLPAVAVIVEEFNVVPVPKAKASEPELVLLIVIEPALKSPKLAGKVNVAAEVPLNCNDDELNVIVPELFKSFSKAITDEELDAKVIVPALVTAPLKVTVPVLAKVVQFKVPFVAVEKVPPQV